MIILPFFESFFTSFNYLSLIDTTVSSTYGAIVSVWVIALSGLFFSFVISVFWRGSKS